MKSVSEAIKNFNRATLSSIQHRAKPQFHEMSPAEYLNFADSDVKKGDARGNVNASSNTSRALELRLDELLHNWGYKPYVDTNGYDFKAKMALMKTLGVLTVVEHNNLMKLRALVEDHYIRPEQEDAKDYLAAVSMFVKYSDRILGFDSHVEIVKTGEPEEWLVFNVDSPTQTIVLFYFELFNEETTKKAKKVTLKLKLSDKSFDEYTKTIKWWLKFIEQ